jgi:hypothetical protein
MQRADICITHCSVLTLFLSGLSFPPPLSPLRKDKGILAPTNHGVISKPFPLPSPAKQADVEKVHPVGLRVGHS